MWKDAPGALCEFAGVDPARKWAQCEKERDEWAALAGQYKQERDAWREIATELVDAAAYGLAQWDDGYSPEVSCKIGDAIMRFQIMTRGGN